MICHCAIISHLMAIKELNQVNDPHILKMFIHYYILDRSFSLFFIFNCFNTPQPTFGKCKNQIQSDWIYLNIHVLSCMHVHETFLRCAGINHKTFRRVKVIPVHQHYRPKIRNFNFDTFTKYTFTQSISVTNNNLVQTKNLRNPNNLYFFLKKI